MATQHKMWAVGGGKGGVGKSVLTLALAIWLAKLGKKVIIVDADLGGANLHTLLGIRYPGATLADFINRKANTLNEVLLDTPHENLKLISGADDILGLANPKFTQKTRLLNQLNALPADFIFLDLGAGTSYNVLDFFLYAAGRIAVFTAQATSLQNVYGFIKSSLLRRLSREFHNDEMLSIIMDKFEAPGDEEKINSIAEAKRILRDVSEEKYRRFCQVMDGFDVKLIVNMVKQDKDREAPSVLRMVAEKYLDIHVTELGSVYYDPEIERSVNRMVPFLLDSTNSRAALSTYQIAYEILKASKHSPVPAAKDSDSSGVDEPAKQVPGRLPVCG